MQKIITVGREFGSGGRELAKRLADELGVAYYDREIITEIAKKASLDEHYVAQALEQGTYAAFPLTFSRSFASYAAAPTGNAQLLGMEQRVVRELAQKGDCIFVGRSADVVLRDYHPLRLFVYADMEARVARCKARAADGEHYSDREYERLINQMDKNRAQNYALLSDTRWGDRQGYDLCINTTDLSPKTAAPLIAAYARAWFGENRG